MPPPPSSGTEPEPLGDRTNASPSRSPSPRKRKYADSANGVNEEVSPDDLIDDAQYKEAEADEKGDESDGKAESKAEEKVADGVADAVMGAGGDIAGSTDPERRGEAPVSLIPGESSIKPGASSASAAPPTVSDDMADAGGAGDSDDDVGQRRLDLSDDEGADGKAGETADEKAVDTAGKPEEKGGEAMDADGVGGVNGISGANEHGVGVSDQDPARPMDQDVEAEESSESEV